MSFILNSDGVYSIVTENRDECLSFAADKLAEYLEKVYSCKVVINKSENCGGRFVLEKTEDSFINNCSSALKYDGYAFVIEDDSVKILSLNTRGVLYGVFDFLEAFAGCRFFTYDCERTERKSKTEIDCGTIVKNPIFSNRNALNAQCVEYEYRAKRADYNNFVYLPYAYGGYEEWFNGKDGIFAMHNSLVYVEPEIYFKDHPELFSVRNGQVTDICFTSGVDDDGNFDPSQTPSCAGIIIDKITEKIKKSDVRHFMIGQIDSWGGNERECQCKTCREAREKYGGSSGVLVRFLNAVSKEVEKRKKQEGIDKPTEIIGFAYSQTFEPPVKYISDKSYPVNAQVIPDKNVGILLCTIGYKNMPIDDARQPQGFYKAYKAWFELTNKIYIWDYCCNYSEYLWYHPVFSAMVKNIRIAAKNKACGFLALFSYGDKNDWQAEMNGYVAAKLMRDTTLDENALRDEYISGVYGDSAKYVKELVDMLESHFESLKEKENFRFKMTKDDDIGFNARFYPKEILLGAIEIMDRAINELDKKSADYGEKLKRLKGVRLTPLRMLHYNYYVYFAGDKKGYYELGEKILSESKECGILSLGENIPMTRISDINNVMKAIDGTGKAAWDVYRMLYQGYVYGYAFPADTLKK